MGRRRRRVVRIVKKKLPTVFVCPRCGEEAVRVTIAKDTGHATVLCALCNLKDDFPAHPAAQAIDVYSYFTDRFYGVKDPRAIIPHEREIQFAPPADDTTEEQPAAQTGESVPEPNAPDMNVERPEIEPPTAPDTSQAELGGNLENASPESVAANDRDSAAVSEVDSAAEVEKKPEEDSEPFADILENKDKKRYSATPLPQQSPEQTG